MKTLTVRCRDERYRDVGTAGILPKNRLKKPKQLPSLTNTAIICGFPACQGEFYARIHPNWPQGLGLASGGDVHYFTGVALEQGLSLVTVAPPIPLDMGERLGCHQTGTKLL